MADGQCSMTFEMSYKDLNGKQCREMTMDVLGIGWPRLYGKRTYAGLLVLAAVPGAIAAGFLVMAAYFGQRGSTFADIWYMYVLLGVFAVLFITLWSFVRIVRKTTQSYQTQMRVDGDRTITLDALGVRVEQPKGETLFHLEWGQMTGLVESPGFYCFGQGRQLFVAVPKKFLKGRQAEFEACLEAYYLSKGRQIRRRDKV